MAVIKSKLIFIMKPNLKSDTVGLLSHSLVLICEDGGVCPQKQWSVNQV